MVQREKPSILALERNAALGEPPSAEELKQQAEAYIANLHIEPKSESEDTAEEEHQEEPEDIRRTDAKHKARVEALSKKIWLAQEIFIRLWVECLDEIIMVHGVPEKEAFKPNRIKLLKPIHPSNGSDKLAFRAAQGALETILPTELSDDYDAYIGVLFEEAKRRWYAEHAELKDRVEFQPVNDNRNED